MYRAVFAIAQLSAPGLLSEGSSRKVSWSPNMIADPRASGPLPPMWEERDTFAEWLQLWLRV